MQPQPTRAQDAWLIVPVVDAPGASMPSHEALLGPWEQALPRVAHNKKAAQVYDQRHSSSAAHLDEAVLARVLAALDRALEQLALGKLDEGRQTLQALSALGDNEREALLHSDTLAQRLFDACMMQAYLLTRQSRALEAKQQLTSCARRFPQPQSDRGFTPKLNAPPPLVTAYEEVRAALQRKPHAALEITSNTSAGCTVFLNGLAQGQTPLRLARVAIGPARVQLRCGDTLSRIHHVTVATDHPKVDIDMQLDAVLDTEHALQLRYRARSQRKARLSQDAAALREALAPDQVALLVLTQAGNTWHVALESLRADGAATERVGEVDFSEAAGYDPQRLRKLVESLTSGERTTVGESRSAAEGTPVTLHTAIPAATATARASLTQDEGPTQAFPTVGVVAAALGVAALGTSWALFAERRAYRLKEWEAVDGEVLGAYQTRGNWTLATAGLGAGLLAASSYLWLPEHDGVPAVAWVLGGLGLAAAGVGIALALGDEHCGPEVVLPRREPCLSVRADGLLGVDIALSALPLATLPLTYLLRDLLQSDDGADAQALSLSLHAGRGALSARVSVAAF